MAWVAKIWLRKPGLNWTFGLPAAWQAETASTAETAIAPGRSTRSTAGGTVVYSAFMDRGYDSEAMPSDARTAACQ